MWGSVFRCGVGEKRSGGRCKGGSGCVEKYGRRCGERCGGSKVKGEVREMWGKMWAMGEDEGRCGKKYDGCREVWSICGKRGGDVQG